ncbi:MAG TPA: C2 family cysteine protease, partial [Archangium sp.]
VVGADASYMGLTYTQPDRVWAQVTANIDAKKPIGAGTFGEDREAQYTNTGVYANHAYSILGYEKSGTDRYVVLRNPWGESEPAGNGANDGIFKLKLEDFTKLYQSLYFQE